MRVNYILLKNIFTIILYLICNYCAGQNDLKSYRLFSTHTSFPDTGRTNGHSYKNVLYQAADHYTDSSVLIFTPKDLDAKKKVDIIFWFHGWGNNIDSAVVRYALTQQFAASKVNAVLVLAETAKDAPDSYGGKLEQAGVFKDLVHDVLVELKRKKVISSKCKPGNIVLAGHSGAYRVMAYILQNGNLPVKGVILFDALYGETSKFMNWIKADTSNRFIDIYTDGGGTDVESKKMMNQLIIEKIRADTIEEKDLTNQLLQSWRIIFIHTLKKHNDIINNPGNLRLFIQNIPFMKKRKE